MDRWLETSASDIEAMEINEIDAAENQRIREIDDDAQVVVNTFSQDVGYMNCIQENVNQLDNFIKDLCLIIPTFDWQTMHPDSYLLSYKDQVGEFIVEMANTLLERIQGTEIYRSKLKGIKNDEDEIQLFHDMIGNRVFNFTTELENEKFAVIQNALQNTLSQQGIDINLEEILQQTLEQQSFEEMEFNTEQYAEQYAIGQQYNLPNQEEVKQRPPSYREREKSNGSRGSSEKSL